MATLQTIEIKIQDEDNDDKQKEMKQMMKESEPFFLTNMMV